MTDEEKLANEYTSSFKLTRPPVAFFYEYVKEAFIAGLKAGSPKWHDLRKNPEDLPKEVGRYIVCYLDSACERHTFELSFVDYFEDKHWIDEDNHNIEGYDEGVIAWCDIPLYMEE